MIGADKFCISCFTSEKVDAMLKLDQKAFSPIYWIDAGTTKNRLEINNQTDIGIWDGSSLVGYISVLPIPKNIYNDLRNSHFDEMTVEQNVLPYSKIGVYDAYLSCIVIDKQKYPKFKSHHLIYALQNHLLRLKKRGIFLRRIIAYAVSIGGHKTLQKMGFKKRTDIIYEYNCLKQGYLFIKRLFDFEHKLSEIILPKIVYL